MNTLLIFTVFFTAACMADVSHLVGKPQIEILKSTQDIHPDGSFHYAFETQNGILTEAQGSPEGETQHGRYRYTAPDGQPVEIVWSAGPLGFVAEGAAIPPTPQSVLRTLEYNAAHPEKDSIHN